jgi:hypothetical protein
MDPYADLQEKLKRKEELLREREEKVKLVVNIGVYVSFEALVHDIIPILQP